MRVPGTVSGRARASPVAARREGILLAIAAPVASALAIIVFGPDYVPNHAGVGIGGVPDHVGSSDDSFGAAPVGRDSWGERYVSVIANMASANIVDHPNWQAGPALTWRFGRDDIADATAARAAASGLPAFDADGGMRDARATAVFIQAVHPSAVVGAGVLDARLLQDAANSPITDQRGAPNQFVFGVGTAWLF